MLCHCLKSRKTTGSKNPKVAKTSKGKIMIHRDVQCAIVKNQSLSNSKKLVDY